MKIQFLLPNFNNYNNENSRVIKFNFYLLIFHNYNNENSKIKK